MIINFTEEAIQDLARLREFIAIKNPHAAKRVAIDLRKGIEKLVHFPELGVKVQNAPKPDKIRDLFVNDYTIRYLISPATIVILRVWHDKEDARSNP